MMRRRLFWAGMIVLAAFVVMASLGMATAQEKKLVKLDTCWMPEHETFAAWYAIQKGWDKEEGLDLKLHYFDSGMAQLEALPAKQWVLGGTGGVPQVFGALRYGAYEIAIGNDESVTNVVMVRPDSPILKTKGYNPKYPEVYGNPEAVKGKTILVTTVSSAHYAMSSWLKTMGLKDSDVVVKNMDQAQAMAAFESGIGDAVALWAPHLYNGLKKGWKIAGDIKLCGAALPITIIGDKEFCDKNPEVVASFLRMYLRAVNAIKADGEKLLPMYKKFYTEWAGMEMDDEMAKMDLNMHPVFGLEDQLKLMDNSKGPSIAETWQIEITKFFTEQGKIKPEERDKVLKSSYVTDKFLKMVKTPIPAAK